jgi:membrane-bound inhibitor of C-type lysozyme
MRNAVCLLVICAVLTLWACQRSNQSAPAATSSPAATQTRAYQCGELPVTATFHGEGPFDVEFVETKLTLPHVPSGSGARYADEHGNANFMFRERNG